MVDVINVMTVNPGFGGQPLLTTMLPKITRLRAIIDESPYSIALEADGGVDVETTPDVVQAGADVLIAGSAIFNAKYDVSDGIKFLRNAME
jgi:ribulose-phosphate 3-epimerase